ncbi:MAG TPA: hypothetical protein VFU88_15895 [Ktedonobacterales bacterium]|nr:hypothetical protein [Ktedonobacterales bacterium]
MSDFDPTQHDPTWQEATDDSRRQRLDALRDIATHTPQAPADATAQPIRASETPRSSLAPPPTPRGPGGRSSRPRPLWLAAGALVLIVVVVSVFALTRPGGASSVLQTAAATATATTTPRTGPLVIRPAVDELGCPTATAWSDDGTQLAVLGTTNCDEQLGQHKLNVYNVTTGKLTAKFRLDNTVINALKVANTSGKTGLSYTYTHALWLGPAVYVTIQVTDSAAADFTTQVPFVALLRVTPSDQQLTAFVQPNRSANAAIYTRWNPTTGTVQITPDTIVSSDGNISATLPASLAYGWRADGTPDPLIPVAAGKQPPHDPGGPVGVPSSGGRLTIWQPGLLVHGFLAGPGAEALIFTTDFDAVSGGQPSVVDGVHLRAPVVPSGKPAPDKKSLDAFNLSSAPWLPVRDAAMKAVVDGLTKDAEGGDTTSASVAWRPDGTVLAVQPGPSFDSQGNPIDADITLYDTKTGHTLSTLKLPPQKGTPVQAQNMLQWSPTGSALMLVDFELETLVIWTQEQLPH